MRTKLFLDTEFTGLHQNTTLVSIGIVSECGKTFYAELKDYDRSQIDSWLQENIIDKLAIADAPANEDDYSICTRHNSNPIGNDLYSGYSHILQCDMEHLKHALTTWLQQFDLVEIWSDCLAYDWVLFNSIFGNAMQIPETVYYIPFDLCTLFYANGIDPDISREQFAAQAISESGEPMFFDDFGNLIVNGKHTALFDAKVIKLCFDKLISDYTV